MNKTKLAAGNTPKPEGRHRNGANGARHNGARGKNRNSTRRAQLGSTTSNLAERKKTLTFQHSESRYQALFNLVPVAVYACDANGVIEEYNQRAADLWGCEPGRNGNGPRFCGSYKIYYPDGRPMPHETCPMARVLRGEELSPKDLEIIVEKPGGERRHVIPAPQILRDERGRIVGAINCLYDITERKQTEERLVEQARLLDLSNDAILVRDARDRIVYWNHGATEIYGYEPEEAIGKLPYELLRTEHPEPRQQILQKLSRHGRWNGELVHTRKDGKKIVVSSRWAIDPDGDGKKPYILETNNDITAQKKFERSLAKAAREQLALYEFVQRRHEARTLEDIYGAAFDAITSAVSCDRAAILLCDDKRMMRFIAWRGLSVAYRKAVEGHSPWKRNVKKPGPVCIPDVNLAKIPDALKKSIKAEGIGAVAFIPLVSESHLIGKFMIYYDAPRAFKDEELKVATTIARQLSLGIGHKGGEEALRESEARLRAIVDQAAAGMARADLQGRLLFVNQKFCRMLGYNQNELIGKAIRDFTHKEDVETTSKLFERLVKKAKSYEVEKRYLRKDGSILWANVSVSPVRNLRGRPQSAVAVIVDITSRKKAEAELQRSKELLENLVQKRTKALRFANTELESEITRRKGLEGQILEISDREQERLGQELHDGLCQQLTAIGFLVRATALRLKDHRVVQTEDLEKIAQLINSSVMDARNIARDLHKEEIEAPEFLPALEDLVHRKIWKTPCRLELKTEVNIEDDKVASQLYRILREALINANKHARATQIVLEVRRVKNELVFNVTDNGVGLSRKPKAGQGLGFHIMQYRAQSIGARLEFESRKKSGSRVSCYLPLSVIK